MLSTKNFALFDTTSGRNSFKTFLLWFAFNKKFCALWHDVLAIWRLTYFVVICFQQKILRSLTRHKFFRVHLKLGCDLLSTKNFALFDTTCIGQDEFFRVLWFAFNKKFCALWHDGILRDSTDGGVVICFQQKILRSLTRQRKKSISTRSRCDLLSTKNFALFDTTPVARYYTGMALWFAFNKKFCALWHDIVVYFTFFIFVVICFQQKILRSLTRLQHGVIVSLSGCDLLSTKNFALFDTTLTLQILSYLQLWFAFNKKFCALWHDHHWKPLPVTSVVICFQQKILRSLTRQELAGKILAGSCDLLSTKNFALFDTTSCTTGIISIRLWFAFNKKFCALWHDNLRTQTASDTVVICFQQKILRSLTRPRENYLYDTQRCDLLSTKNFALFDTTLLYFIHFFTLLWFAFNKKFCALWHDSTVYDNVDVLVVICFQQKILRSLTRQNRCRWPGAPCCDLLSTKNFALFDTTYPSQSLNSQIFKWLLRKIKAGVRSTKTTNPLRFSFLKGFAVLEHL